MRFVQAGEATALAEISSHQLREWCGRRGILKPDVEGRGPGRHALYSWQTLMVLRVLRQLREQFRIELSAWTLFANSFRNELYRVSFVQMWGATLHISDHERAKVIFKGESKDNLAGLFIELDYHLTVLSQGLSLPGPTEQLPLFAAVRHA